GAWAAAAVGGRGLGECYERLTRDGGRGTGDGSGRLAELASKFESAFRAVLDDDLNAPRACAALFQLVHDGNAALDAGASGAAVAIEVLDRAMGVLDILPTIRTPDPAFGRWVEERIAARDTARKAKDFKEADRIRAELLAWGLARV